MENERAMRELRGLEGEFWRAWGEPMLDGKVDYKDFRGQIARLAVDAYRVGLITAAQLIEERTRPSNRTVE